MKLLWSTRSPFVRKVCIAAHELGIESQIEKVPTLVAMTIPASPDVLAVNPLGRIPALLLPDGTGLFDSRVICEYLDMQYGPQLFPADVSSRVQQLRWQALADGLLDVLLLWRTERGREEQQSPAITEAFEIKVRSAMAQLANQSELLVASDFGIGHVAIVSALEYLDFRWPGTNWAAAFPDLANWHAQAVTRSSVQASPFSDPQAAAVSEPVFQFADR